MNADVLNHALQGLPHGPEFRFLDRLIALVPGKSGTGEYRVRGDEPFLSGHFPGKPLFPGVLLIEAAAQLSGVVAQCDPCIPAWPDLRLTAIRLAKIIGTARPGEVIRTQAVILGRMDNLVQAEVVVTSGGTTLLTAQVTLSGEARQNRPSLA